MAQPQRSPERVPASDFLKGIAFLAMPLVFVLVFFYAPLGEIFRISFGAGFGKSEIDLNRVVSVFSFTAWQAFLSTVFTVLAGLPAAFIYARYRFFGKRFLNALFSIPFILPTIVTTTAFNALIGPKGWVNQIWMALTDAATPPVKLLNTFTIILIAHVFYNVSVVIRMLGTAWAGLDKRYEEAARVTGASPVQTFIHVIFPLLRPTLQSAALIVFLFDFTSYGVVLLLGGGAFRTVEVEISQQALFLLNLPMAATLSILQLAVTLGITILDQLSSRIYGTNRYPKVSGENLRPIHGFFRRIWITLYLVGLTLFLGLPLLALVVRSLYVFPNESGRLGVAAGWTAAYFKQLFINDRRSFFYVPPFQALLNSFITGGLTGVLATLFATLIVFAESRYRWVRRFEGIFILSIGTSAITLGLGYLVTFRAYLRNPFLIAAAHALIALPFALRSLKPAILAIPISLRQSSAVLGANAWTTFFRVEIPLVRRALLNAFIFSMTISLGEFGASSFLTTPERPTLPIAIYRLLGQPGPMNLGQAMALSTILLLLCLVSVWLLDWTSGVESGSDQS